MGKMENIRIFHEELLKQAKEGNKILEYTCEHCNHTHTSRQRKINYKLCMFLHTLAEMNKKTGKYIHYSDVVEECYKNNGIRVTDYAILFHFFLIKNQEGNVGNGKIAITKEGIKFLHSELAISDHYFYISDLDKYIYSPRKIFIDDIFDEYERENNKECKIVNN